MDNSYLNGGNANWENEYRPPVYDEQIKIFPCTFTSVLKRQPGGYTLVVGIVGRWVPEWLEGGFKGNYGTYAEWWGTWN